LGNIDSQFFSSLLPAVMADLRVNVTDRLTAIAAQMPEAIAVACPRGNKSFATITFAELDVDATWLARGLADWGVPPGTRLALLVRPGIEFVTLVFALLRAGMVIILVDPGLGRRNLVRCLAAVEPEGFVAIPVAQAARLLVRHKFPRAKWNITVGHRWFWGGITLAELRKRGDGTRSVPTTMADDPAAIIFTSGSTGPPKGVLYTHRMFDTQVAEIQATYGIQPDAVDLACFPLFALFNAAMGVTTVFPEMDFSRPASADPRKLIDVANHWRATQAFASPAVWRVVGEHCAKTGERIESLRQVFSCGAPVAADVLRKTLACVAPGAKMHTPYGATECLPVATIEAAEVLGETAARTDEGAGVCVGRKFDSIDWRVIRITDDPIATIDETEELPPGEIGELIVRGPQASPEYVTSAEHTAAAKIADRTSQSEIRNPKSEIAFWHRMGDVGYLDEHSRFWYCGRKSQRVVTIDGTLFTECVEAIVNTYPGVRRSALVGIGPHGEQSPVLFIEKNMDGDNPEPLDLLQQLAKEQKIWPSIDRLLSSPRLPVDVRHNAKINREKLAAWATQLSEIK
jgi:acyl-CoA synthetase (AMP-forming)/AMP-acid ligase II